MNVNVVQGRMTAARSLYTAAIGTTAYTEAGLLNPQLVGQQREKT